MPANAQLVFLIAIAVGVHVGMLPPLMPEMRRAFSIDFVAAGWLISMVQIGSLALGFVAGSFAERFGRGRMVLLGCIVIALGDLFCAMAYALGDAWPLFVGRFIGSVGQIAVVVSAPALIMRLVRPERLGLAMGIYACYMPFGMALGMLTSPGLASTQSPALVWIVAMTFPLILALAFRQFVWPSVAESRQPWRPLEALEDLRAAIRFKKPLLLAACFGAYGAQWITVMSWLPSFYVDQGVAPASAAKLTAVAVLANCVGNVSGGWLLQRGVSRAAISCTTFLVMLGCAYLLFSRPQSFVLGFVALLVFSAVGGMIPGMLFASSRAYSPSPSAVPSTVGVMTQGTGLGQTLGPPMLALLVQSTGSWSASWAFNAALAAIGFFVSYLFAKADSGLANNEPTKASKLS